MDETDGCGYFTMILYNIFLNQQSNGIYVAANIPTRIFN